MGDGFGCQQNAFQQTRRVTLARQGGPNLIELFESVQQRFDRIRHSQEMLSDPALVNPGNCTPVVWLLFAQQDFQDILQTPRLFCLVGTAQHMGGILRPGL